MAWNKAAMAMLSSTVSGTSQILNSTVLYDGCTRRSHQIFLGLSIQFVFISNFVKLSYASKLSKLSGMPVRGNLSKTLVRNDLYPVLRPSQNGELVLIAKT